MTPGLCCVIDKSPNNCRPILESLDFPRVIKQNPCKTIVFKIMETFYTPYHMNTHHLIWREDSTESGRAFGSWLVEYEILGVIIYGR